MTDPDVLRALAHSVDATARATIDARRIDAEGAIPGDVVGALAELGVFGLTMPEAYGGMGLGLDAACAAVRTLATHDRSVATMVGLHLGLGTRGMVVGGRPALLDTIAPGIAAGTSIAAFATTEPEAGSDIAALRTTAQGSPLLVNGTKIYVTNARRAAVYTITASTPGLGGRRRGHTLIVLRKGDPGLTVGPDEHKLGLRGSSTATLTLDDTPAEDDRLLGTPGDGMVLLRHVLSWGRTVMAAGCCGSAHRALELTRRHTWLRRQFGRPLAELEVVRDHLARMAVDVWVMDAVVAAATRAEDDEASLIWASTVAKVFVSDANWRVVDQAVQLHGGSGYIEDTGLPLLLRDARIPRIFEGANDVLIGHLGLRPERDRAPWSGRSPIGATADRIHERYLAERRALVRAHGVHLSRRHRPLHQLGQLGLLRDVTDAAAARAAAEPEGTALAQAWAEDIDRRLLGPMVVEHPHLAAVAALEEAP